jgi:hypothetical protein
MEATMEKVNSIAFNIQKGKQNCILTSNAVS